jgi:hypothetical protein
MAYQLCNPMTCGGLGTNIFGGCSMVWVSFVILFFLIIFARKYLGEEAGVPFSFIGALIGGFGADLIVVVFTCSYKFGLAAGIGGVILLGIVFSSIFEGLGGG